MNTTITENEKIIGNVVSIDELKLLYITLGVNFKQDKNNINNGYPILIWQ